MEMLARKWIDRVRLRQGLIRHNRWNHYSNACLENIHDDLLRAETGVGDVTKVFQVSFLRIRKRKRLIELQSQYISH